ncbi:MAG: DMT family transporter [Bacteroidales bacterium]|nr:DMT family transporter [Bacteroidales bacterium]
MKPQHNQKKAYLFALIAVVFWSTMSSAFKLTLQGIAFDELLLWASIFGFFTLLIVNQFGSRRLEFSEISKGDVGRSAIMGFINPFLYYLILFKAYELLEAQLAGTLNYAWPVILVLLSGIILKQKIRLVSYLALIISFIGLIIISTKGQFNFVNVDHPTGIVLAVGSAFVWAFYWILNMKDPREDTGKITLNLFFGLVYLLIYLFVSGKEILFPTGWTLAGCIYIGMFEMSLTFVIWLKALNTSENTAKVSNLIYLSPFIGLFFIRLMVGEPILISTIVGLAIIIAGILIQQFPVKKGNPKIE